MSHPKNGLINRDLDNLLRLHKPRDIDLKSTEDLVYKISCKTGLFQSGMQIFPKQSLSRINDKTSKVLDKGQQ